MIKFNSSDPKDSAYFYPIMFVLIVIIGLIELFIRNSKHHLIISSDKDDETQHRKISTSVFEDKNYPKDFLEKKNSLRIRYLSAYILTRAGMWSKTPYMYTLYNKYHGFSIEEIGILYAIDAFSALFSGPVFGNLADKYGRKLFCMFYCIFVSINLGLRLTGNKPLAYLAQVLTGFGAGLINTTFESWLVYESDKTFGEEFKFERERFLKRLFKNQTLYDSLISLVVTGISAIIFTFWGILAPVVFSMILSIAAFFVIYTLWDENKPQGEPTIKEKASFFEAFKELKKTEVLCFGIIESLFQAVLNIFIFCWTPLLQMSTDGEINVGFIFCCYVLLMIINTALFEIFIISYKFSYYGSMFCVLLTETTLWLVIYFCNSFFIRLLGLAMINVKINFTL